MPSTRAGKPAKHTEEWQRHTVQLKLRCSPELAEQGREVAQRRGLTLADVFAAGVRSLNEGTGDG